MSASTSKAAPSTVTSSEAAGASITGEIVINATSGTVHNLVGACYVTQHSMVTANDVTMNLGELNAKNSNSFVFGGGMVSSPAAFFSMRKITVVIDGANLAHFYGGGYVNSGAAYSNTESVFITVNSGSFSGNLYGGGRAEAEGHEAVGRITLVINGGTFSHVVGGGYSMTGGTSEVAGDIDITVRGGTFNGTIFGGGHRRVGETSGKAIVRGDITITVDLSGGNTVTFREGSGITAGGCNSSEVYGNTTLTLIGRSENLKTGENLFNGWLNASGCGTSSAKAHTLSFVNFTGNAFEARVQGFNVLDFAGDTRFTVTRGLVWGCDINYSFDLTGRGEFSSYAFMTQAKGSLGITEKSKFTLTLSRADIDAAGGSSGSFMLLDGMDVDWDFGSSCFSLVFNDSSGKLSGYGGIGDILSIYDLDFRLACNDGTFSLEWSKVAGPTSFRDEPAGTASGWLA